MYRTGFQTPNVVFNLKSIRTRRAEFIYINFSHLGLLRAGWFYDQQKWCSLHCQKFHLDVCLLCKLKIFEITQSQCATHNEQIHRIEIHLESWKWKHCSGIALARCQTPLSIDFSLAEEFQLYLQNIYQVGSYIYIYIYIALLSISICRKLQFSYTLNVYRRFFIR